MPKHDNWGTESPSSGWLLQWLPMEYRQTRKVGGHARSYNASNGEGRMNLNRKGLLHGNGCSHKLGLTDCFNCPLPECRLVKIKDDDNT